MTKERSLARGWRAAGLLGVAALLGGCSSFRGAPAWEPAQRLEAIDAVYASYVARAFAVQDASTRALVRNEYITVRLAIVDIAYSEYREGLYSQRVGSAVGFDLATLGLTAGAAATSSVVAKTNMSALSAGLIGSKTSIDKNVYFDRTLPALLTQMDALRSEIRARLFAGMLLPADTYQLAAANSDLNKYREAGSLIEAVKSITTQAGRAETKADETLRGRLPSETAITQELSRRGFAVTKTAYTASALSVQSCVGPDGKVAAEVFEPLDAWFKAEHPKWKAKQEAGSIAPSITPFNDFLTDSAYESLRAQALSDSALKSIFEKCARK